MFTATKIESNIKPNTFESLNNGVWYYNYDISEYTTLVRDIETDEEKEETRYSFIQVRIWGKPTYSKCVKAIIREYISVESEFDLINSYNSYQLDVNTSDGNYVEYLELIKEIKNKVGNDFLKEDTIQESTTPKQSDLIKLLMMTINSMDLTDQQSLQVKSLYPDWKDFIGKSLEQDKKIKYNNKLYKVVQTHTAQEQYFPSISTASLYTEVVEDKSGTIDDPIPYPSDGNMTIYNGKYYVEDGIIYKCIRDSEQPLYTQLQYVVGNYVEKIDTLI